MSYAQALLPEFEQEMASTRKVLERVPDDKLDWKPHDKSHTIGWNANHVADIVNWLAVILKTRELDIAPVNGPRYQLPNLRSRAEILEMFDKNVAAAKEAIAKTTDEDAAQPWSLSRAGQAMFTMPRSAAIRSFAMNHLIHHRAFLCAYYRQNDIPVPGMYGPSGDE